MNAEHLLDAVGLLDDDLIREAERYSRPKPRHNYGAWLSCAACLAVVIALGYGLARPGMGGGNTAAGAPMGSAPAASAPDSEEAGAESMPPPPGAGSDYNGADTPGEPAGSGVSQGGDVPAIMAEGVLYRSTGIPVPGEPDESAVRTVTSYTDGTPETDGQTNFSEDLSAQYALTPLGLVVRTDHGWILFEPVSP